MATTVRVLFSDDEKHIIRQAASAAWNEIGYDAITSIAEAHGKDPDAFTLSRPAVIELALDANRADRFLERSTRDWDEPRRTDFFQRFARASYPQLCRIVRPAFPHSRWGL